MFIVGQRKSLTKVFDEDEVLMFSKVSMDGNPIHFDKEYAAQSRFKRRIVQGPFVVSLIGGILGSHLPGPGTIYLHQTTSFIKPVFIGDEVTANVEVQHVREDKPIVRLRTWVVNQNGETVIDGEAVILFLGV